MKGEFHPWGKADPKPKATTIVRRAQQPLDERERLAELSDAWQVFGCAVCGQIASREAGPGWRIELHHTTNRSQGGHDSPLLGLCGELLPGKCHWRVTTNRLSVDLSPSGWAWTDTRTGETGLCRVLDADLAAVTGLDRALTAPPSELQARVWKRRPIPVERAEAIARDEGIDVRTIMGGGLQGAEDRFNLCRQLSHRAQRAWMSLAIVIQKSLEMGDAGLLGFESQEEWSDAIGIDEGTMSKLVTIGRQFAGAWEGLAEADKRMLSINGLYTAARMVKLGHWTEAEALSEAVAQPVHKLYRAMREAEEIAAGDPVKQFGAHAHHACPACGLWHVPLEALEIEEPPVE